MDLPGDIQTAIIPLLDRLSLYMLSRTCLQHNSMCKGKNVPKRKKTLDYLIAREGEYELLHKLGIKVVSKHITVAARRNNLEFMMKCSKHVTYHVVHLNAAISTHAETVISYLKRRVEYNKETLIACIQYNYPVQLIEPRTNVVRKVVASDPSSFTCAYYMSLKSTLNSGYVLPLVLPSSDTITKMYISMKCNIAILRLLYNDGCTLGSELMTHAIKRRDREVVLFMLGNGYYVHYEQYALSKGWNDVEVISRLKRRENW